MLSAVGKHAHSPRSPSPEPEEEVPLLGNTRGGAKAASERVKAQAVILFWKSVAGGMKKMAAYAFAGPWEQDSLCQG